MVSIKDALDNYLGDVYRKESSDRYSFVDGSTSNGVVVYQGKFVFSHHESDPASNQLCNSFDIIRLQKFGHLDTEVMDRTPVNRWPSYVAMVEWMEGIDGVKKELIESGMSEITAADFDAFDEGESWMERLDTNQNGVVKSKYSNMALIINNDPEIKGTMHYNEFSCRPEMWKDGKFVSVCQDFPCP